MPEPLGASVGKLLEQAAPGNALSVQNIGKQASSVKSPFETLRFESILSDAVDEALPPEVAFTDPGIETGPEAPHTVGNSMNGKLLPPVSAESGQSLPVTDSADTQLKETAPPVDLNAHVDVRATTTPDGAKPTTVGLDDSVAIPVPAVKVESQQSATAQNGTVEIKHNPRIHSSLQPKSTGVALEPQPVPIAQAKQAVQPTTDQMSDGRPAVDPTLKSDRRAVNGLVDNLRGMPALTTDVAKEIKPEGQSPKMEQQAAPKSFFHPGQTQKSDSGFVIASPVIQQSRELKPVDVVQQRPVVRLEERVNPSFSVEPREQLSPSLEARFKPMEQVGSTLEPKMAREENVRMFMANSATAQVTSASPQPQPQVAMQSAILTPSVVREVQEASAPQPSNPALTASRPSQELVDDVQAQVQRFVALRAAAQGQVSLQLHPRELGRLDIDFRHDAGEVQIQISTREAGTREILESALPKLRASLAEAGVNLGDLDVKEEREDQSANQFADQRNSGGERLEEGVAETSPEVTASMDNMEGRLHIRV